MSSQDDNGADAPVKSIVHCWDPQARRMVCGAAGQIGSTKHVRDVTCVPCLDLLGKPSRAPVSAIPD